MTRCPRFGLAIIQQGLQGVPVLNLQGGQSPGRATGWTTPTDRYYACRRGENHEPRLWRPIALERQIRGNRSAIATPISAMVAASCRSACRMSGPCRSSAVSSSSEMATSPSRPCGGPSSPGDRRQGGRRLRSGFIRTPSAAILLVILSAHPAIPQRASLRKQGGLAGRCGNFLHLPA